MATIDYARVSLTRPELGSPTGPPVPLRQGFSREDQRHHGGKASVQGMYRVRPRRRHPRRHPPRPLHVERHRVEQTLPLMGLDSRPMRIPRNLRRAHGGLSHALIRAVRPRGWDPQRNAGLGRGGATSWVIFRADSLLLLGFSVATLEMQKAAASLKGVLWLMNREVDQPQSRTAADFRAR